MDMIVHYYISIYRYLFFVLNMFNGFNYDAANVLISK